MIEPDTVKLLRECDAGIKMGVTAIDEVQDAVRSDQLRKLLLDGKADHEKLKEKIQVLLDRYQDDGKDPNPMEKGMSTMKTNVKMAVNYSDATIADLMTDGCNMGVKSLARYLNQYQAADEETKNITEDLICLEERMAVDLRAYL